MANTTTTRKHSHQIEELKDIFQWACIAVESCSKCKEDGCEEEWENSKTKEKILVRDCEPETRDELPKAIFE